MLFLLGIIICSDPDTIMFQKVNEYRKEKGLPPYKRSPELDKSAKVQSDYMAKTDVMSHTGEAPNNVNWQDRIKNSGYKGSPGGENVAQWHRDEWKWVIDAWKSSPGHNKNLLGSYKDIGIASTRASNNKRFWTQNFGDGKGQEGGDDKKGGDAKKGPEEQKAGGDKQKAGGDDKGGSDKGGDDKGGDDKKGDDAKKSDDAKRGGDSPSPEAGGDKPQTKPPVPQNNPSQYPWCRACKIERIKAMIMWLKGLL